MWRRALRGRPPARVCELLPLHSLPAPQRHGRFGSGPGRARQPADRAGRGARPQVPAARRLGEALLLGVWLGALQPEPGRPGADDDPVRLVRLRPRHPAAGPLPRRHGRGLGAHPRRRPSAARGRPHLTARARDFGIVVGTLPPGPANAITDVAGVRVGHTTLIEGDGPLVVGRGPVRTGVTVIVPGAADPWAEPAVAGCHRLNGNGELTGLEWIREAGLLTTVIGLTNTHSVGVVRDALIAAAAATVSPEEQRWYLPVVGETYDGDLNDINGMHVRPEHVHAALDSASGGPVAEGGVGSGTGMQCHGFKGGIGTASRVVAGSTVGVLVQANHGRRDRLRVNGVQVGPLPGEEPANGTNSGPEGSIIVIVATDAPLLPGQCDRLAQRAALGIGRVGGAGEHASGDIILAFATGNRGLRPLVDHTIEGAPPVQMTALPADRMDGLFYAVIEATEEAIVNALVAGQTMTGGDGYTVQGIGGARLADCLRDAAGT